MSDLITLSPSDASLLVWDKAATLGGVPVKVSMDPTPSERHKAYIGVILWRHTHDGSYCTHEFQVATNVVEPYVSFFQGHYDMNRAEAEADVEERWSRVRRDFGWV